MHILEKNVIFVIVLDARELLYISLFLIVVLFYY